MTKCFSKKVPILSLGNVRVYSWLIARLLVEQLYKKKKKVFPDAIIKPKIIICSSRGLLGSVRDRVLEFRQ